MKIILTEQELTQTLRKHYPVPEGYTVEDVDLRKHSNDFCTVEFSRIVLTDCEALKKGFDVETSAYEKPPASPDDMPL
jgi:hypothetical protein